MTARWIFLAATVVYSAALVATVFLSRATPRRVAGAVAGGLSVAAAGAWVEWTCQGLGFWRYPSDASRFGPAMIYPVVVLAWTIYPLIGWRVLRRFGWRGEAAFLGAVTAIGVVRDYWVAGRALGLIDLHPGIPTLLVDAACWAGLTALSQVAMRLVSGPAGAGRLARSGEGPEGLGPGCVGRG